MWAPPEEVPVRGEGALLWAAAVAVAKAAAGAAWTTPDQLGVPVLARRALTTLRAEPMDPMGSVTESACPETPPPARPSPIVGAI